MVKIEIIRNLIILTGIINNLIIIIGALRRKLNKSYLETKKSNTLYITLIFVNVVLFSVYGVLRNYK